MLECIVLVGGAQLSAEDLPYPELIYVERGSIAFHDPFGFAVTAGGGESIVLQQWTGYDFCALAEETTIKRASSVRGGLLRIASRRDRRSGELAVNLRSANDNGPPY